MKFRKVLGAAAATAAAAVASVVAASPVSAATWDHVWTTTDANPGGTIYVKEYGDVLRVCDTDADGYYALANITFTRPGGGVTNMTLSASGNGNCQESTANNVNIPENVTVKVQIGLGKSGVSGLKFVSYHEFKNDH